MVSEIQLSHSRLSAFDRGLPDKNDQFVKKFLNIVSREISKILSFRTIIGFRSSIVLIVRSARILFKRIQKVIVPFERPRYDSGTTISRTTTISSISITTVFLRIDSPTLSRTKSHSLSDLRLKKRPSTPPLTIDYLRSSIIRTITV